MAEGNCVGCDCITKYVCLKCDKFACNRSLECSIPASEDYPGWKECKKVALCLKCDKEEHKSIEKQTEQTDDPNLQGFEEEEAGTDYKLVIPCASRGFHEYRKIWSPKLGQKLIVKREKANVFDPYAMGLYCKIKGKIENLTLVGHLPREISRFCKFYVEYSGELGATVRSTKFRRSPLPQGGLEIPIDFLVKISKASEDIYKKMKVFVKENYMEPEKIPLSVKVEDEEDDFF